jgi:hypothetical protein
MPGRARSESCQRACRALAVGLLLLVTPPVAPAGAADSRGAASQDGWWNRLQGPADRRALPTESGGLASDPVAFASGQPAFAPATPPATGAAESALPVGPPAEAALPAPPADPVPRAGAAVDFWEHVPTPTALLVPVAIGLAVLIGVVLGPGGRPSPVLAREGGLSRALARRSPGGEDGVRPPAAVR